MTEEQGKKSEGERFRKKVKARLSLPQKVSVRTTFELTEEAVADLEWILEHQDTSIKNLLDYVCFWLDENYWAYGNVEDGGPFLKRTVSGTKNYSDDSNKFVRKTYVLSRYSLDMLNKLSNETKLKRDSIIDSAIKLYKMMSDDSDPLILEEVKHMRKKFCSNFDDYFLDIYGEAPAITMGTVLENIEDGIYYAWKEFEEACKNFDEKLDLYIKENEGKVRKES